MQKELIQQEHIDLLKKSFGITFDDIEKMTEDEFDEFKQKIIYFICDYIDTEYFDIAEDVADIILGPYEIIPEPEEKSE